MRISDWSSDVCSSDLQDAVEPAGELPRLVAEEGHHGGHDHHAHDRGVEEHRGGQAEAEHLDERAVAEGERSEERRVGKEWVSTGRSRWSAYHSKKNGKSIHR